MHHNCIIHLIDLFVPYPFKDLVGTEYPVFIGCQQIKNVKLNRRKGDFFPVLFHHMGSLINHQILNLYLFFFIWQRFFSGFDRRISLHLRFYSGQQFQRMERFGQIVIGARTEADDFIHIFRFCR